LTAIGWFIVNIQSDLFWHRCLERLTFDTSRMYTLSPSKNIKLKGSNYGEFLKDKNLYTVRPLITRCTDRTKKNNIQAKLQISCVFAFFMLWKRVKTHVLSDQSVHITHTYFTRMKLCQELRIEFSVALALIHVLAHFQRTTCSQIYFRFSSYLLRKLHLFVLTANQYFPVSTILV
jgi:hypothetical protein